jgi:molybdate transport system substrate-binding protein
MTTKSLLMGLCLLLASACTREASSDRAPARVFAAASLVDVLDDAADAFERTGGVRPLFNLAGSAALARQIEQGAEADLFITADKDWVDYLEERDLVADGGARLLAGNVLVVAAPSDAQPVAWSGLASLPDALGEERLAIADPASAPAGRYAEAALTAAGVWSEVQDRLVLGENVRATLAYVESGEAGAAIVYRTDAMAAGASVQVWETLDPSLHPPIAYWIAPIAQTSPSESARDFASFLLSDEGQAALAARGFVPAAIAQGGQVEGKAP